MCGIFEVGSIGIASRFSEVPVEVVQGVSRCQVQSVELVGIAQAGVVDGDVELKSWLDIDRVDDGGRRLPDGPV